LEYKTNNFCGGWVHYKTNKIGGGGGEEKENRVWETKTKTISVRLVKSNKWRREGLE
jgi:hypothetical protein